MNDISDSEFIQDAFIQEGVSPTLDVFILACTVGDDYDDPKNRVGVKKGDLWLDFSLAGEAILSIDASADGLAYVLGENGTIVRFNWKHPATKDELGASRTLFPNLPVYDKGPLRRIRIIGSDVICAGSVGQVYWLNNEKIEALPPLRVEGDYVTIEDIAGTSRNDFVAVTSDGYAAHFNGKRWATLDIPTNTDLTSICPLAGQNYAISGGDGVVLIGSGDQWQVLNHDDEERHYWGIASHAGSIYAAHLAGIDKVSGEDLIALKIPNSKKLQFTVLRSSDWGVWSFAERTVGLIRNDQWQTVMS